MLSFLIYFLFSLHGWIVGEIKDTCILQKIFYHEWVSYVWAMWFWVGIQKVGNPANIASLSGFGTITKITFVLD